VSLELIYGENYNHTRPFHVPQSFEETTKTETKRSTYIDVSNRKTDYGWAAPTFIQAKTTGDLRMLTDLRRLNAHRNRKSFPLSKISDILR
jgi:hypothetical protein